MPKNERLIITGGHFRLNEDGSPHLNDGTIESFDRAVSLFIVLREETQSNIGLLINNIGHLKEIEDSFSLPKEYQSILEKHNIEGSAIILFWERYIRNRAGLFLKKERRNESSLIKDSTLYVTPNGKEVPVAAKENTPTCSLISAIFYKELEKQGFTQALNVWYTGEDNTHNVPDKDSLGCGNELKELTDQRISVDNLYF